MCEEEGYVQFIEFEGCKLRKWKVGKFSTAHQTIYEGLAGTRWTSCSLSSAKNVE